MPKQRFTTEEIIHKLREADVLSGQGQTVAQVCKQLGVTDKYYFLSKFDLTGAGAGVISGSPGRPREWAVTIKKKF